MKRSRFNADWIFHEGAGCSLDAMSGTALAEKAVCLPHDASIEQTRNPAGDNGSGNPMRHSARTGTPISMSTSRTMCALKKRTR